MAAGVMATLLWHGRICNTRLLLSRRAVLSCVGGCRLLPGLKPWPLFPTNWYLWALVSNFLLRMSWAHRLFGDLEAHNEVLMVVCLLEVVRRWQWAYIRIETELRKLGLAGTMVLPGSKSDMLLEVPLGASAARWGSIGRQGRTLSDAESSGGGWGVLRGMRNMLRHSVGGGVETTRGVHVKHESVESRGSMRGNGSTEGPGDSIEGWSHGEDEVERPLLATSVATGGISGTQLVHHVPAGTVGQVPPYAYGL
jgi:hypothetical protein